MLLKLELEGYMENPHKIENSTAGDDDDNEETSFGGGKAAGPQKNQANQNQKHLFLIILAEI